MSATNASLPFIFLIVILATSFLFIAFTENFSLPAQASDVSACVSPYPNASRPIIGGDIVMEFYSAHWGARNSTIITDFINKYGIRSWRHEQAYYGFRYSYVYVEPEKECSKMLVFLYDTPDLTRIDNRRVIWAKLVDKGVELHRLNDSEARDMGIFGNATPETNNMLSDLYNKYPGTNDSRVIMDFTNDHGFGGWYSKNAYEGYDDAYPGDAKKLVTYDYIYILPAEDYDQKLFILYQVRGAMNESDNGVILIIYVPNDYEHPPASSVSNLSWPGSDFLFEFYGMHPNAKNNSEIQDFINTYGMSSWDEKTAYAGYKYIYVLPKRNYPKDLVYLNANDDERQVNNTIKWVKLIDKEERLSPLNDSEARAMGLIGSATPETNDNISASPAPGFMPASAIAAIAITLLIIKMKRKSE